MWTLNPPSGEHPKGDGGERQVWASRAGPYDGGALWRPGEDLP